MNNGSFESQLSVLCQMTDNYLEDSFGHLYPLHPNRMKRGEGANPSYDGLFSTTFAFSLGYGSKYGRGYVVQVDIRTLSPVSTEIRKEIDNRTFEYLREKLLEVFPDRELSIVKDGNLMKITGDFTNR